MSPVSRRYRILQTLLCTDIHTSYTSYKVLQMRPCIVLNGPLSSTRRASLSGPSLRCLAAAAAAPSPSSSPSSSGRDRPAPSAKRRPGQKPTNNKGAPSQKKGESEAAPPLKPRGPVDRTNTAGTGRERLPLTTFKRGDKVDGVVRLVSSNGLIVRTRAIQVRLPLVCSSTVHSPSSHLLVLFSSPHIISGSLSFFFLLHSYTGRFHPHQRAG
jgi:hypothetical protein